MIPKPFYKQKLFVFFLLVLLCSIMFLAYQLYFVNQLQHSTEMMTENMSHKFQSGKPTSNRLVEVNPKREILRGIRIRDIENYTKIFLDQKFKCLDGNAEISWDKLNDDFCDCPDGSDETFTNAVSYYSQLFIQHKLLKINITFSVTTENFIAQSSYDIKQAVGLTSPFLLAESTTEFATAS